MNQTIYVTTDDIGFITDFKLTVADGFDSCDTELCYWAAKEIR